MPLPAAELSLVIEELSAIRREMLSREEQARELLNRVHPAHARSARNLVHYMALRRHDIRDLQDRLAGLGLSSLGRSEAHVLSNVEAILSIASRLVGTDPPVPSGSRPPTTLEEGRELLARNTRALLGGRDRPRNVRIMVTLPTEAADDEALVRSLLEAGMDCARINCAHDDEAVWSRMVENVRAGERASGRGCKIMMDLAGPKLRTGPIEPGAAVLKWKPRRDELGRTVEPARVRLYAGGDAPAAPSGAGAALPVSADWLARLAPGDRLELVDARGRRRALEVVEASGDGAIAECAKTAYVTEGTVLRRVAPGGRAADETRAGALAGSERRIALAVGDRLVLTRDPAPGEPAVYDERGRLVRPAHVSCTLPEIFDDVRAGERIYFDDGKIGGRVRSADDGAIVVEVVRARARGAKLAADKGINLPDTALRLPALTPKDASDLRFVVEHADVVALSFVNDPSDVLALDALLDDLGGRGLGVVLKIETLRAFENLSDLLLVSMRNPAPGVMIARGDLAVECGFERLAEVQEEILWLCEAAHVPVVWATQVLEGLAKEGFPSRAEVTDAAMSNRAECVMLNKGPHVVTAVRVLDDILRRMETHQDKKRSMLRRLGIARTGRLIKELTPR